MCTHKSFLLQQKKKVKSEADIEKIKKAETEMQKIE